MRDVSGSQDPALIALLQQLRAEAGRRPASRLFVRGLAQAIGVHLARNYASLATATRSATPALPGFKLRRITAWMAEHLAEEFSLARLSAIFRQVLVGGLLQSVTFVTGIKALLLIVAVLYLAAVLTRPRHAQLHRLGANDLRGRRHQRRIAEIRAHSGNFREHVVDAVERALLAQLVGEVRHHPAGHLVHLDADVLARVSAGLGEPMVGISTQTLDPSELLETRGW